MHRLGEFGFSADNFKFDIAKIVARSRAVSQQLSNGVGFLMKKHKITVIPGSAKLAGKGKLTVTTGRQDQPTTPPRISCWPPARGPAPCRGWSRTAC